MRSLVTGGAGFIGSHLVDALISAGDEACVLDDLSTGSEQNVGRHLESGAAELVRCDVADGEAVAEAFGRFRPDRVFHLAAQASVRISLDEPLRDGRANVLGTVSILEAARRHDAVPVVYASTGGAIYGEGEGRELPLDESAQVQPEAPYATSKLAGEHYVELYSRALGVPGISLRFGNVYGPRQDPDGEAGVVAIFCGRLIAGRRPTVFDDGLQTRDYTYVGDVVAALVAAAERLAGDEALPPVVNIGTGVEGTVLDLVEALIPEAVESFEPEFAPPREGEIRRIALDCSLAARALGWRAEVSLPNGIAQTLSSFRDGS